MKTDQLWPMLDISNQKGWRFPKLEMGTPWTIFYGETGSGKTELARHIVGTYEGWEGWEFIRVNEFFATMAGMKQYQTKLFYEVIKKHPRMVLDEVGYEQDELRAYYGKIFPVEEMKDILHTRHGMGLRTIITTNLDPVDIALKYDGKEALEYEKDEYGNVVKDEDDNPVVAAITGRIYSRIRQVATWFSCSGDRRNGQKAVIERRLIENGQGK